MLSTQLNDAHLFYSLPSTEVKQLNRFFVIQRVVVFLKTTRAQFFFLVGIRESMKEQLINCKGCYSLEYNYI